ncbi:hypothetical protein BJV78DRAFT_98200 [Lactifluus subvellereus]|nr:hypothetical protein BJV78DRAFT_98200 [Lactifluus subvellereus]
MGYLPPLSIPPRVNERTAWIRVSRQSREILEEHLLIGQGLWRNGVQFLHNSLSTCDRAQRACVPPRGVPCGKGKGRFRRSAWQEKAAMGSTRVLKSYPTPAVIHRSIVSISVRLVLYFALGATPAVCVQDFNGSWACKIGKHEHYYRQREIKETGK